MPVRPTARWINDVLLAATHSDRHISVPVATSSRRVPKRAISRLASSIEVSEPAAVPSMARPSTPGAAPTCSLTSARRPAQLPNTMPPRAKQ